MISNIHSLPFRTAKTQSLSVAIGKYISTKYNQHPNMFTEDFTKIDSLREDAIHVTEPHVSGISKIIAYAVQLAYMARKFPNDLGIDFIWYPALGYNGQEPTSLDNLKFEQASVLYNLAALYTQLAVSSNRNTTEGLKSVCNYLCLATGVIGYIQESIIPEMQIPPPDDIDHLTLEYFKQLILAQAQECFWRKAVLDGYRDSSIAKLAAKTSDLYRTAGDWGIKSKTISSQWIHFAIAKHYHFAAAAQYRQACVCLEKKKYGEEVARLRDSIACAKDGLREAKYVNKLVQEDLNNLKKKATEDLRRAEKDNDMIYLCPVPPKTELENLERVVMAVPKIPLEVSEPLSFLGERDGLIKPLFAKLVPFAIHVAASIFEQRLDRLVNNSIISPLEALTTKIHHTLSSLTLPGSLQALENPLGFTPTLTSHAEEIRQADAISRLQRSFSDISSLAHSATCIYAEAGSHLISERSDNERLKVKYGIDRWTRPDSSLAAPKLYKQLDEIDGYIKSASNSDRLNHEKFIACKDMLRILSSSDRDLCNFVPAASHIKMSHKLEEHVSRVRSSLDELSQLEYKRRKNIESLREKAKKDDINQSILIEASRLERSFPSQILVPAHFEDFLEERLSKYDSYICALKTEEEEQEKLLKELENYHRDFIKSREELSISDRKREKVLQDLENAYFQYKEIINNLESGRKFYNDLGRMVAKFNDQVKTWVIERREESVRLERELEFEEVNPVSALQPQCQKQQEQHLSSKASHTQPRYLCSPGDNDTSEDSQILMSPASQTSNFPEKPVTAIWNPSMGINFASSNTNTKLRKASGNLEYSEDVIFEDDTRDIKSTVDCGGRQSNLCSVDTNVQNSTADKRRKNHTWNSQQGLNFG